MGRRMRVNAAWAAGRGVLPAMVAGACAVLVLLSVCLSAAATLPPNSTSRQAGLIGDGGTPQLPSYRPGNSAFWHEEQRVAYILGGGSPSTAILSFDPTQGATGYTSVAGFMPYTFRDASLVWAGDVAYVFPGLTTDIFRFNPQNGSVTLLPVHLPQPRHSAGAVWTGSVAYLFGGSVPGPVSGWQGTSDIIRFDPAAMSVQVITTRLPWPAFAAGAVWDGKDHAFITGVMTDEVLRFNASAQPPTIEEVATLPFNLMDAGVVWDGSSMVIFGGRTFPNPSHTQTGGGVAVIQPLVWRFDPVTLAVTPMPPMHAPASALSAVYDACNSRAFLISGETTHVPAGISVREYGDSQAPVQVCAPTPEAAAGPPPEPSEPEAEPATLECGPARHDATRLEKVVVEASGGVPPYTWTAEGGSDPTADGADFEVTYELSGNYTITVMDAADDPAFDTCFVQVAPEPRAAEPEPAAPPEPEPEAPAEAVLAPGLTAVHSGAEAPTNDAASAKPQTAVGVTRDGADWLPVGVVAAVTAAAGVFLLALRSFVIVPLASLFTRLRKAKLLEQPLRAQIHAIIKAQPGIHFREITRGVGREVGVVLHHLRILAEGNLVRVQQSEGHCRYFVTEIEDPVVMRAMAQLWSPSTRRVLQAVADRPGLTLEEVAALAGMRYGAVWTHAKRLRKAGLVLASRQARVLHLHPTKLAARLLTQGADELTMGEAAAVRTTDDTRAGHRATSKQAAADS